MRPVRVGLSACVGLGVLTAVVGVWGGVASDPTKGYSFATSYDNAVKTVHVPIFGNTTYNHGIETEFTDALIKEIQTKTPWRVVGEQDAQTVLTGVITDSEMRQLSVNRDTGYAQELNVQLTIDFAWKDVKTGKTIVSRKRFSASDTFIPSQPVGERIEAGNHGAVQNLARDVVAELRSKW